MTDKANKKRDEQRNKEDGMILKKGISPNRIINEIDPMNDNYDRRILFEMTGLKLDEDDFIDEDSLEDENFSSGSDEDVGEGG